MLHDSRVVDGEVGRALLEVIRWVTTRSHDLLDELACAGDRDRRIIHELGLNPGPARSEARALGNAQLVEAKVLHTPRALRKLTLGTCDAAVLFDCTVVFGTELQP